MNHRFDGKWRWAITIAVFIGAAVGMVLPEEWHLLVRSVVVGLVTGALLFAVAALRPVRGDD